MLIMQLYFYIYYVLLLASFTLFLIFKKRDRNLKYIGALLLISFLTEVTVEILIQSGRPYYFLYHFYGLLDYILLVYYLYKNQPVKFIRSVMLWSIPLVFFTCLYLSIFRIGLNNYQGMNIIIRGAILILFSIITLFTFHDEKPIYRVPVFWISVGLIIFFSGTFFMNGVYNGLIKNYPTDKNYYKKLHGIINLGFNYLLYLIFCLAIICSPPKKKYALP